MDTVLVKMSEAVGSVLRLYREKSGLKQGDISSKAGISVSMLSQIERGVTSPSIETLSRICLVLGVSMSQIFEAIEESKSVNISKQGERPLRESGGARYEQITHYNASTGSAEFFMLTLEVGSKIGFPANSEVREGAQMGYVLSGAATLIVDGEEYAIKSGDGISFPAKLAHSIINDPKKSFNLSRRFVALWAAVPSRRAQVEFG